MEESVNHSEDSIPRDNIRSIQTEIKDQLDNYEREIPGTSFQETSNICDCVRDGILNYKDEPHLTKCQNNCRRIFIASELLTSICSVYENIVDYEFTRTVWDLVEWEKYGKLSREITKKFRLETRAEKRFIMEAQRKLKEADVRNSKVTVGGDASQLADETETEFVAIYEAETPAGGQKIVETTESGTADLNGSLDYAPESIFGNVTAMRDEPVTEQQFRFSHVSRPDLTVPVTAVDVSIQQPEVQNHDASLREILEILEGPIEQPKISLESAEEPAADQAVGQPGNQTDSLEEPEEWTLPSFEPVKTTRRPRRLIIDKETTIEHYAERAMHLNRNITIRRVQVYEGPPDVLEAFSTINLMKTPAFKTSGIRGVRSSRLNTLYSRHQRTEAREVESVRPKSVVDKQRDDFSKATANLEITEDVVARAGMHSAAERTDLLAEILPKRSRLEDLEIPSAAAPPNESLIGVPLARINNSVQPLEQDRLERINIPPISPRVHHRQGQTIEPKTTPPWFPPTRPDVPSAKFREFDYVYKTIQKYWLAFEDERMEKCISIREFLSLESAKSVANYLTVLRVVDKMSLQRKLKLEFKDGVVLIRPFRSLDFSDGQSTHLRS